MEASIYKGNLYWKPLFTKEILNRILYLQEILTGIIYFQRNSLLEADI